MTERIRKTASATARVRSRSPVVPYEEPSTPNRLRYEDNWSVDLYFIGNKQISELKEVMIGGTLYKVKTQRLSIPYDDMGHTYEGTSDHYFVKAKVFGIYMDFDLNKIVTRRAVYATLFKLREPS